MTVQASATLASDRAALVEALQRALLDAGDTAELRARISKVDREVAFAAAKRAADEAKAQADADEQAAMLATALAASIRDRRDMILADTQPPPEVLMDFDTISGPAADLVSADAALEHAQARMAEAQAHGNKITNRVISLEAIRADIVARRAKGDHRADDAAVLALVDADLEGLRGLVAEHAPAFAALRLDLASATAQRAHALKELSHAEDQALASALTERAAVLDGLLLDIVGKLSAISKRTSSRPPWVASAPLLQALTILAAQRPDLATAGAPGSKYPALRRVG